MKIGFFDKTDFREVTRRVRGHIGGSVGLVDTDVDTTTRHEILERATQAFANTNQRFSKHDIWRLCLPDGREILDELPNGQPFSLRNMSLMYGRAQYRAVLYLCRDGKEIFKTISYKVLKTSFRYLLHNRYSILVYECYLVTRIT